MTRFFLLPLLFVVSTQILAARTLEVGGGGAYTNLEAAAADALPGDTILFRGGTYSGGQYVADLQGRADAWITILAAPGEEVILSGGGNAWQLSDAAYLRIAGFIIEGQTGNGINIDDGGSYDTPTHHLIFERCTWRAMNASGNNDQLKLSGLDSFEIRDCIFQDGAEGGSMIDMVGCHDGIFTGNRFERAGSNCIQAKGGTRDILIERNTFIDGGARAINIGGSTGLEFFRPLGVNYESAEIRVYSNTFVGSTAPVAFVGTVNSEVVNNTFYLPDRLVLRILQETTEPNFLQCGDNSFINNIIVFDNAISSGGLNIGSNTRPETFTFANNLWYHIEDPGWAGPSLPSTETNGIIGSNPMLRNAPIDMTPLPGSPTIGAGASVVEPALDYLGRRFATPRSIGAIEGGSTSSVAGSGAQAESAIRFINEGGEPRLFILPKASGEVTITVVDIRGMVMQHYTAVVAQAGNALEVDLRALPAGSYLITVGNGGVMSTSKIMLQR